MQIYLVGGAVRDQLLGRPVHERDWVVVGATPEHMLALGYRQVGKDFPVFLHPQTHEEYALARTERKVGKGYKGFACYAAPDVTLEDDLIRRDLTINAMAQTDDGQIIDPYHGQTDLQNHVLRHVSPAFAEDPVRILRVARFAARFTNFKVHPSTLQLMQQMVEQGEVNALVPERVWQELERALDEPSPQRFFAVLMQCNALPILFPELVDNREGFIALMRAAELQLPATIKFAALLHSLSKDQINNLCQKYRVPREFSDLAMNAAQQYSHFINLFSLNAEQILIFFESLDTFRRKERLQQFLQTCHAIDSSSDYRKKADYLNQLLQALKSINNQEFVQQGLTGENFANAIRTRRLEIIQAIINNPH